MPDPRDASRIGDHVTKKVAVLQKQYARAEKARTSFAQATVAKLRRNRLDDISANPSTWEYLFDGLPEEFRSSSEEPSIAEAAVHQATTLYAIHQQGRSDPMHIKGAQFGKVVRTLALRRRPADNPLDPGTLARFQQLCVASSPAMRLKHLRTLIILLRGEQIPLDYGLLAKNLFHLQIPRLRHRVLLDWGRDFHFSPAKDTTEATTTTPEETA